MTKPPDRCNLGHDLGASLMDFELFDFRNAWAMLQAREAAMDDLVTVIRATVLEPRVRGHRASHQRVLKEALHQRGWARDVPLFTREGAPRFDLDCVKDHVGVEIEFSSERAIQAQWLKFMIASHVDIANLGVQIVYSARGLDALGREKTATPQFHRVRNWLLQPEIERLVKLPILLLGIY